MRIDRLAELADNDEVIDRSFLPFGKDRDLAGLVGEPEYRPGLVSGLVTQGDAHALADGVVLQPDRLGEVAIEDESEAAGATEEFDLAGMRDLREWSSTWLTSWSRMFVLSTTDLPRFWFSY